MIQKFLALSTLTISVILSTKINNLQEDSDSTQKEFREITEAQRRKIQNAIEYTKDANLKYKKQAVNDIPDSLHWGHSDNFGKKTHPINWLTTVKNQHLPIYCGSCWAQALTSTLSDRINIQINNGVGVEVSISPQMLVSCSLDDATEMFGCDGGDTLNGAKFIEDNYLLDDSCMPYTATNGTCSDPNKICFDRLGSSTRNADFNLLKKWSVKDVQAITRFFDQTNSTLSDQEKQEIIDQNMINMLDAIQSGPIVCGISVPEDLETWSGKKIYTNPVNSSYVHDISVVGYDQTGDIPYWIVRNSWGEPWGYGGFWNVEMGKGILGIELLCRTFTPIEKTDPTTVKSDVLRTAWINGSKPQPSGEVSEESSRMFNKKTKDDDKHKNMFEIFVKHLKQTSFLSSNSKAHKGCTKASWEDESVSHLLKSRKPYNMISEYKDLPKSYTYSDYKDQNVLTWVVNQHLPEYCGSCYAQAAVSSFADRINKLHVDNNMFDPTTRTTLSTQQVLNCGVGTCDAGGSSLAVFEFFIQKFAVPWGCAIYKATSPINPMCTDMQVCSTCPPEGDCEVVKPIEYHAKEWGVVTGPAQMKDQIFNHGPIQCSVMVSDKFWNWKGNDIFAEKNWKISLDHAIAVVGWGYDADKDTEYWILRNTWGTMWGNGGFARVQMWKDNVGIESDCGYIIPADKSAQ